MRSMDYSEYKDIIRTRMGDKRYNHSLNVAESAVMLAEKYGADKKKAYLAGLLHDICKETPENEQLKIMTDFGIIISNVEKSAFKLWHAMSGAAYVKNVLKIDDQDIINAIRYHTTARAGMSLLEKVIYLADFISADRSYDGVDELRSAADQSMDKAMDIALTFSIVELIGQGKAIHPDTVFAYNELAMNGKHSN